MITPTSIDSHVEKLIFKICKTSTPVYLPIKPESYAEPLYCFPAVQEKIKRDGGQMILGWQIWKGNFLVEGEFHAVWESPTKGLVDITPKQVPLEEYYFYLILI